MRGFVVALVLLLCAQTIASKGLDALFLAFLIPKFNGTFPIDNVDGAVLRLVMDDSAKVVPTWFLVDFGTVRSALDVLGIGVDGSSFNGLLLSCFGVLFAAKGRKADFLVSFPPLKELTGCFGNRSFRFGGTIPKLVLLLIQRKWLGRTVGRLVRIPVLLRTCFLDRRNWLCRSFDPFPWIKAGLLPFQFISR